MPAHRLYDWDLWFGRPCTVIRRGVDYRCSQSSMCQIIRNNAWRRRVRVRLTDTRDAITIEVVNAVPRANKAAIPG